MPSGTLIVKEHKNAPGSAALCARGSGPDQKNDLDAQVGRLSAFASARGFTVSTVVSEIGPGLNGLRPKLIKIMSDPNISTIIIEHRDRLMRLGTEYVESPLLAQGRKIVIVDQAELKDDLSLDMIKVNKAHAKDVSTD